jgi:hypothetical protein
MINDIFCKLLYLNNIQEFDKFISKITNILRDNNKKNKKNILDKLEFNFDNNLYIFNFEKHNNPIWLSKSNLKIKNYNNKNITHNRIIIYKYDAITIYIEKCGQSKILNKYINSFDNIDINFSNKNIDTTEILYTEISNFILNKKEIIANIDNICTKLNISSIDYITDNDYSFDNFNNLYQDLITNKLIDNDKKLSNLICNDCLNNNKKGYNENKYNKLICDNNPDKYTLLDCKTVLNCEIADIYDKENLYLFHNKRNKDLRILATQIINGLLLLKTKPELCLDYINEYNIDINNFKYVFGIIKEKENITTPHILSIGLTCHILKKLNIEYYIDFIEVIK